MRKKSKEDEQTLEEFNSPHRRSQAKSQLVQINYIERIKLVLLLPYNMNNLIRLMIKITISSLVIGLKKSYFLLNPNFPLFS